jgi:hypothetical protein
MNPSHLPGWLQDFDRFCELVTEKLGRTDLTTGQLEEIFTTPLPVCGREKTQVGKGWADDTWLIWLKNRLPDYKCATSRVFNGEYQPGGLLGVFPTAHAVMIAHAGRSPGQQAKLGHTNGG